MDFTCTTFPGTDINISLFSLVDAETNTDQIQERKNKLLELMQTHAANLTIINPKYVNSF